MSKGDATREAILERALERSSLIGLGGLTIGALAAEMDMSKSGLFAHFRSKEALQLGVVEAAAQRFIEYVIRPAVAGPPGAPRIRRVFEHWLRWEHTALPGGCFFIQASVEMDDQRGPLRDLVAQRQRQWLEWITEAARRAQALGHFRADIDPAQFAFAWYSLILGYHHSARLLGDVRAEDRLRAGFDDLMRAAESPTLSSILAPEE